MLADGGSPEIRVRKGMKCIKGLAAELRRKKWSIHTGRSGAEENMTSGEESLDDLEGGVSRHCLATSTLSRSKKMKGNPARMRSIKRWKVEPAFPKPKGIRMNLS